MASSSSSSIRKSFKYDVFLSFRGEDTRKTFVDHLYHALHQKGITTYKDDERIEKGERIGEQLIRSIEQSRFHIIIFSKNYASSSWCLDELVKIVECQRTTEQTAYPIFYDVEPTEVRNQNGVFGEAFAKHVEKEGVGRWRDALKEAAGLAGWELKTTLDGHEAKFIEKVIEEILPKLYFINLSIDENLVGMEIRVNKIISSLEIGLDGVRMIGIKGIGGGGKTTLARAVFDHISIQFDGKSFVENVREGSKGSGLRELQKQVIQDVLCDKTIDVKSVHDGKNMMKKIMPDRKVLVVLDDVDHIDQLKALAGSPNWFKPGSKIIITTRDEQVLVAHRVNFIHDVSLLSDEESVCLFCRCAFEREIPLQGYEELSRKVVQYSSGLPLTITVLGSFLCGRVVREWEDALERLKTIPESQTLERLELSYNGLENDYKEIFLDVACILKGETKENAIRILESCGFNAEIGLSVLAKKSLITVSDHGYLSLHDLIAEMGWNIVRRMHPDEPNKHNRLWIKEEIEDILVKGLGTKLTRSIQLKDAHLHPAVIMKGLRMMKKLRFLSVNDDYRQWKVDEVGQYLPNALRYLNWPRYPFHFLPKTFRPNDLVTLELHLSYISQLWEGGERKIFNKLKFLDLSKSKLRTFDLGLTPELETLDLDGCLDFEELYSAFECPKLKFLNLCGSKVRNLNLVMTPNLVTTILNHCSHLVNLQMPIKCPNLKFMLLANSKLSKLNLGLTPQLETLDLQGCNDLVEVQFPTECSKLKSLLLSGSMLSKLNLGLTPQLETLYLQGCNDLVEIHMPTQCSNLKSLVLSGSMLSKLDLGLTPQLETLHLEGLNDHVEIHMPSECSKLKSLVLSGSMLSKLNLGLTPQIETLHLIGCNDKEVHIPIECSNLKSLVLNGSMLSNLYLGFTPHLENLHIGGCNELVELHLPAECSKLKFLTLNGSKLSNLYLGFTPHLETLHLQGCHDLVELHLPAQWSKMKSLALSGSKLSKLNLGLTPQLETLYVQGCSDLVEVYMPTECLKLKSLVLGGFMLSKLNLGMTPQLETLHLIGCYDIEVHIPIECSKLRSLLLNGSRLTNLYLEFSQHLETLHIGGCNELMELHLPAECSELKSLSLSGSKLSKLNLGLTPELETLYLDGCNDLVEVHMPSECSKLKSLVFKGSMLSKLDLGSTPELESLDLEGCNDLVEVHMPTECSKLKFLVLRGSMLSKLNLGLTPELESLVLERCNGLVEVHMPVECPKLKYLVLSGAMLSKLNLGLTPELESLVLEGCNDLVEVHMPIECPKLKSLVLSGSILGKLKLGLTPELETLHLMECKDTEVDMPTECSTLKSLFISDSKLSKLDLGMAPQLETLYLGKCKDFVELHMPVECSKLNSLVLSGSKVSKLDLGLTPQLKVLELENCSYLEEIHAPLGCLENIVHLKLCGCSRFERFLGSNRYLLPYINSLATLELSAKSLDMCPLHPNNNLPKFQFKCFYDEALPSSSGNLEKLLSFGLCACTNLETFSSSICGLQRLRKLTLEGSFPEVPKDLYQLESLEELTLSMKEIKHLPDSICMLKHLKSLNLKFCWLLEQLPTDICRLECLEELQLMDCISLRDIPNSICKMKRLEYLDIHYCVLVDKLPEELGRLECLKVLNIEGAGISHLPQSIYQLKGLRVVGSRLQLESYGFTTLSTVSSNKTCCYVKL